MRHITAFCVLFLLFISGITHAQNLEFKIIPSNSSIQLFDTIEFSLSLADDIQADSVYFYADQRQRLLTQMGLSTFFAKSVGTSVITCNAFVNGQLYTQTTTVTVTEKVDPEPEKLHFAHDEMNMLVNSTARIQLYPKNKPDVKFEIKDESIAAIDADYQVIKGVKPGETNLFAYWNNQVASCLIRVYTNDSVLSDVLSIIPNPIKMEVGESIAVEIISKSMIMLPITAKIENTNIADFDETGMLLGKTAGRTWLIASQGDYTSRVLITVYNGDSIPNKHIRIAPNPIKVQMGESVQVGLRTMYSIPFQYHILDPTIAKVTEDGVVYGLSKGRTLLIAKQGQLSDTAYVYVSPADTAELPVVSVSVTLGQTVALKRLFPRYSDSMLLSIQSNGNILLDGKLNVHGVKEGRSKIVFLNQEKKALFKGIILVKGKTYEEDSSIEDIWFEDRQTVKIKFKKPIAIRAEMLLHNMIKVEIVNNENSILKSSELIEVLDAYFLEGNTTLVVKLSKEIADNVSIKVMVNQGLLLFDEETDAKFEAVLPALITSLNEKLDGSIRIYPNPAKSELNIKASSPIKNLQVLNVQGEQLISKSGKGVEQATLDITQLNSGIYFLLVSTKNKTLFKTSFLKQ